MRRLAPRTLLAVLCASALSAAACSATPTDQSDPSNTGPSASDSASDETSSAGGDTGSGKEPDAGAGPTTTVFEAVPLTFEGQTPAPEFPADYDWFNVSRPLSMAGDLRGKIVLLDFWTQGCINCIHIIPDLHRLEQEYPDELVVVAVHWAKFPSERTSEAVREAVRRYGRQHPIVNDDQELLRQAYGVRKWPTVVVIDPKGRVVGQYASEGVYSALEPAISTMAAEYGHNGDIDPRPLGDLLAVAPALPTVLSFPGKVLADEAGDRLFIADTGRHRVLVATLDGALVDVIGAGTEGQRDGEFGEAAFRRPQGMALGGNGHILYIADRENHLIRAADLRTRQVTTVAGTGEPVTRFEPGRATDVAIASPWDLHTQGDLLFIAGAGRHQIWVLNLSSGSIETFAGTAAEGLDDGHRLAATLSQPSGLASHAGLLYFTDPEASAVRQISLGLDGELTTLVGKHLFVWGDEVGDFSDTLLQHAIGIEHVPASSLDESSDSSRLGLLYIADTYNHRIKVLDLATMTSRLAVGDGTAGLRDGVGEDAQLAEPSGLSATSTTLYVADTNNHRVRVLDLATGELGTLALSNLEIAAVTATGVVDDEVVLLPQQIAPGSVEIVLDFELPDAYKFNADGMFTFEWSPDDAAVVTPTGPAMYQERGPTMPVRLNAQVDADAISAESTVTISATSTVFYCPAVDEAFCLVRDVNFTVPLEITSTGASRIELPHRLLSAQELEQRLASP